MLKQKSVLEIEIAGKSYYMYCDSDSPLGCLHDALMQMKGWCVDRMIKAQQEELENAELKKQQNSEE